jgi:hypothetical protein
MQGANARLAQGRDVDFCRTRIRHDDNRQVGLSDAWEMKSPIAHVWLIGASRGSTTEARLSRRF